MDYALGFLYGYFVGRDDANHADNFVYGMIAGNIEWLFDN